MCALSCPFSGPFSRHSSPLFLSRSLSDSAFPRKKAVRKHLMTATVPSETRSGPVLSGPAPEAPAFFGDYRQNRAHPWTQSCPLSARHNRAFRRPQWPGGRPLSHRIPSSPGCALEVPPGCRLPSGRLRERTGFFPGFSINLLAVGHGFLNVRTAAQLESKQQIHGVFALFGQVRDLCVKGHDSGFNRRNAGQNTADNRGIDDRFPHGTALIHVQDNPYIYWRRWTWSCHKNKNAPAPASLIQDCNS